MPADPAAAATEVVAGVADLVDRYDGFLVDQFGVLYDGVRPLPGADEALALLVQAGKRVVILSNSGRRAFPNEQRLRRLGYPPELYTAVVSSGEVAWQGLKDRTDPAFADLGRRCLLFSRAGDQSTVEGLDVALARDADGADFVLLAGLDPHETARARCREQLARAGARGIPVVCANPDLVSLEGDRRVEGPGAFAAAHAEAGGEVRYVGKPWPAIYRAALATADLPPRRLLAVGDSLAHDIGGAARFGIDGALVTGGVHASAFAGAADAATMLARLKDLEVAGEPRPRWLLRSFRP
jgi:HAD superfamily hydrolase (TIGR01459 family)